MRKTNVFGKKINQVKVIYFIVFIFAVVFGARVYILNLQANRLAYYQEQEEDILNRIDDIVGSNQTESYHLIGEIIQYLPNTYTEAQISDEVEFVMNLSGLSLAQGVEVTVEEEANTPFGNEVPTTVKAISVGLSYSTNNLTGIMEFVNHLYDQDRIYYIESLNVNINLSGQATVNMIFYTFINDVVVT